MKNLKTLSIVSLLSISIVSNSVSFAIANTAQAAQPVAGFSIVAKEIKAAKKAIALGGKAGAVIGTMAGNLVEAGVTMSDVDTYVKATQSPSEYERYENSVKNAMAGVGSDVAVNSKEFAEVLSKAVAAGSNNGLAWESCGAKIGGWVLIGAAVIVGIVALTKTKGAAKIRAEYNDRKQNRTSQYNADKYYIENAQVTIPQQIVSNNGKISKNNERIAYLNGQNSALDPTSSQFASNATEIQNLIKANTDLNNQNTQLTLDLVYYSNAENRAKDLAALKATYDLDMAELEADEADDVASVPQKKKNAKILGIVAGSTAVIGSVLAFGSKCN